MNPAWCAFGIFVIMVIFAIESSVKENNHNQSLADALIGLVFKNGKSKFTVTKAEPFNIFHTKGIKVVFNGKTGAGFSLNSPEQCVNILKTRTANVVVINSLWK